MEFFHQVFWKNLMVEPHLKATTFLFCFLSHPVGSHVRERAASVQSGLVICGLQSIFLMCLIRSRQKEKAANFSQKLTPLMPLGSKLPGAAVQFSGSNVEVITST
jgi:hypothetical protein